MKYLLLALACVSLVSCDDRLERTYTVLYTDGAGNHKYEHARIISTSDMWVRFYTEDGFEMVVNGPHSFFVEQLPSEVVETLPKR